MYIRAQRQARLSSKCFIWFYKVHMNSLVIFSWNIVHLTTPYLQFRDFFYKLFYKSWINYWSDWRQWPWQQRGVPGHSPCWHGSGCQLPRGPGSGASCAHTRLRSSERPARACPEQQQILLGQQRWTLLGQAAQPCELPSSPAHSDCHCTHFHSTDLFCRSKPALTDVSHLFHIN